MREIAVWNKQTGKLKTKGGSAFIRFLEEVGGLWRFSISYSQRAACCWLEGNLFCCWVCELWRGVPEPSLRGFPTPF